MDKEIGKIVINGVTELIMQSQRSLENEQWNPNGNPDKMDHDLVMFKKRVTKLRKIREELEDCISGVVGWSE